MAALRGTDWITASGARRSALVKARGVQASTPVNIPFTRGGDAFTEFHFWNDALPDVIQAASQEGKDVALGAVAKGFLTVQGDGIILSQVPKLVAENTGSIAVKASMTRIDGALRTMLDAMSRGSAPGTRSADGFLCLDVINATRFWNSTGTLALDYAFLAAKTSIPTSEKIAAAAEGAKEGLHDVGVVAGKALSAAGEGIGSAGAGFFKGLGVVNSVVLVGGALYVGTKVL